MMLDEVKLALRITSNDLDVEIQSLIDAAIADLKLSGISPAKAEDITDPLIKRAIITYCQAHFDYDDKAADRLLQSYIMLKSHLALAEDYRAGETL